MELHPESKQKPASTRTDGFAPFAEEESPFFDPAMDDPVFHEGQDALIPDGMWNNRLNAWYAVDASDAAAASKPCEDPDLNAPHHCVEFGRTDS